MRKAFILFSSLLVLASCGKYYGHVIESDYSFDGKFGKYDTYNFIADKNFEGTELHQELIEKFMEQNMDNWGYSRSDKKPSLLVFYRLYYEDFKMKGYNQPDFEQWLSENHGAQLDEKSIADDQAAPEDALAGFDPFEESGFVKKDKKLVAYDPILCDLREGTLLISFYDRKRRKTIWQGYASGIFGNDRFDNNRFVRHIVYRILDKYRVLADKSVASNS